MCDLPSFTTRLENIAFNDLQCSLQGAALGSGKLSACCLTDVPVSLCSPETEWRKRKASRRGAEEEEEEEDDDSGEEMKALRERQREELSKVVSGDPRPPPCVILGFLPTWWLERSEAI